MAYILTKRSGMVGVTMPERFSPENVAPQVARPGVHIEKEEKKEEEICVSCLWCEYSTPVATLLDANPTLTLRSFSAILVARTPGSSHSYRSQSLTARFPE